TLPAGDQVYDNYVYTDNNGNTTGQIFGNFYNQLYFGFNTSAMYFSESPYVTNDVNGVFVGYSSIKTIKQNGGYTISNFNNFSNFNDFLNLKSPDGSTNPPNYVSSTSLSYKRGLLTSQIIYNSTNNLLSQVTNNY